MRITTLRDFECSCTLRSVQSAEGISCRCAAESKRSIIGEFDLGIQWLLTIFLILFNNHKVIFISFAIALICVILHFKFHHFSNSLTKQVFILHFTAFKTFLYHNFYASHLQQNRQKNENTKSLKRSIAFKNHRSIHNRMMHEQLLRMQTQSHIIFRNNISMH